MYLKIEKMENLFYIRYYEKLIKWEIIIQYWQENIIIIYWHWKIGES